MKNPLELLKKVEQIKKENPLDINDREDLAIGVMNLISLEEHLFFTLEKTQKPKYLSLLYDVRKIRIEAYGKLLPDPEGESWCVGKHLLAASMRLMEVGTKALKNGRQEEARRWFDLSFELFVDFWQIAAKKGNSQSATNPAAENRVNDLSGWINKTLNCCRE